MPIIDERPTIIVNHQEGVSRCALAEVLYGIEEEGIPYEVRSVTSTADVRRLAHSAALESRLGVGVGATPSAVAVTLEKLPEDAPYISATLNLKRALDRAIGTNAARLVKRMPLRDLRGDE